MVDPSALSFPASGTVAAWQRQLAPWQPAALWVGHHFFHRVETLVAMTAPKSLDRLAALILQALSLEKEPASVARLQQRLHLPEAMLRQSVEQLRAEGLVEPRCISLTDSGRAALAEGVYPRRTWQRGQFAFLERLEETGRRAGPPHFFPLDARDAAVWSAAPPFDQTWLCTALGQSAVWKQRWGFPLSVQALADSAPPEVPAWQRVTLVRPEHTLAALLISQTGPERRLLAFVPQHGGGALSTSSPFFDVAVEMHDEVQELTPEPSEGDVQAAWTAWCSRRGILSALALACPCRLDGLALIVQAPPLLLHELRGKGLDTDYEEWLLLGAGPMRRAAHLQIVTT